MIDPTDVRSLTDFRRNTAAHIKRLRRTGKPQVLTTNGRATLVVQDAAAYEKQLRDLEQHRLEHLLLEGLTLSPSKINSPAQLRKHLEAHLASLGRER